MADKVNQKVLFICAIGKHATCYMYVFVQTSHYSLGDIKAMLLAQKLKLCCIVLNVVNSVHEMITMAWENKKVCSLSHRSWHWHTIHIIPPLFTLSSKLSSHHATSILDSPFFA